MAYYSTFGSLQNELKSYYLSTGRRMQFNEAVDSLFSGGRLLTKRPPEDNRKMIGQMDCGAFNSLVDGIAFQVHPSTELSRRVDEEDMIPQLRDVFIIRHPRYTRPYLHRHNYVEMDYVADTLKTAVESQRRLRAAFKKR